MGETKFRASTEPHRVPSKCPSGRAVVPAIHRGNSMTIRRNEVAVIARLAPTTIAYLSVPLLPSEQAALAAFVARHGVEPHVLAHDLLMDVIFNRAGFVECDGGVSCTEPYADGPQKPGKSSARSCRAMHDCAVRPSDEPAKGSGPTRQPRSSRLALAVQYARPATSSPAIENHPEDRSRPSSPKSAGGRCE
jgi:hypothetical protein